MSGQRSQADYFFAWTGWRKKGARSYGDVCDCRIGVPPADRFDKTKCCEECVGCNQRILKLKILRHRKECRAYIEFEKRIATIKPGDEFVDLTGYTGNTLLINPPHVRCCYCGRAVRDRLEEWHWRNNCVGRKEEQEEKYVAGIFAAEPFVGSDE